MPKDASLIVNAGPVPLPANLAVTISEAVILASVIIVPLK
jgi:hypothetical protein